MNSGDLDDLRLQMAELKGETQTPIAIWHQRVESINDSTHALMNLAESLWWAGSYEVARKTAEQALNRLEQKLQLHLKNEVLYRGRRALVLAILGREEEARAELARVRQLPLCESCDYCTCKDADIFEAVIEELCGHDQKALELHQRGMDRWPDELDFAAGAARLNRKGT